MFAQPSKWVLKIIRLKCLTMGFQRGWLVYIRIKSVRTNITVRLAVQAIAKGSLAWELLTKYPSLHHVIVLTGKYRHGNLVWSLCTGNSLSIPVPSLRHHHATLPPPQPCNTTRTRSVFKTCQYDVVRCVNSSQFRLFVVYAYRCTNILEDWLIGIVIGG